MKANILIFISSIFLFACTVSKSSRYDYTYLYDEDQKAIKPSFKVFHHQNDSSTLFFKLKSDDVLFGKLSNDSTLTARILCKYRVYHPEDQKTILDSTTVAFHSFGENSNQNILQSHFSFKLASGSIYPMELRFRDQYRDLNVVYYLWLDKRINGNEQFYLIRNEEEVIIDKQVNLSESIIIEKSPLLPEGLYTLYFSDYSYSMTPPPFAEPATERETLDYDSSRNIIFVDNKTRVENWSTINQLKCNSEDSLLPFYFYDYYPAFPDISEFNQMIEPLRYITTTKEYNQLKNAANIKREIDNFWLKIGGNAEKAEKMLRLYYKRVQMANEKFTSYKEGWKTDRGIIYIVYGQPTNIYKGISSETWVYGEENNILSIKFQFNRKADARTNNRFDLIRNPDFKNNWYRAVDQWRQGKVF